MVILGVTGTVFLESHLAVGSRAQLILDFYSHGYLKSLKKHFLIINTTVFCRMET